MNALHRYYLVLALIVFILLVTGNAFAQSPRVSDLTPEQQRVQDEADLRFMMKEIAKMRYTEVCASIKPMPASLLEIIQQGVAAKNPEASKAAEWYNGLMEKYMSAGCGDA
jgi:hypothetical protein